MLVDGDLLSYKITSGLEEAINWGNDNWTLWSDFNLAKQHNIDVPKTINESGIYYEEVPLLKGMHVFLQVK